MWFSGYTDRAYRQFPDNDRFQDRMLWKPLVEKSEPAWVAAHPETVEMLHDRGVEHIVTDGPSFGAADDGQGPHVAGLKYGMSLPRTPPSWAGFRSAGRSSSERPTRCATSRPRSPRVFAIKSAADRGVGETS